MIFFEKKKQRSFRFFLIGLAAFLGTWGCNGAAEDSGSFENRVQGCEGDAAFDPAYPFVSSGSYVQDKNYYLLTLFQQVPSVSKQLAREPSLQLFGENREDRLRNAVETCASDLDCYADALLFDEETTEEIGDALVEVFSRGVMACTLIEGHMRPSGMFQRYAAATDEEMLRNVWMDTEESLWIVFVSYAGSLSADRLDRIVWKVSEANPGPMPFFEPLLQVDMAVLEALDRDEAGRYEPLKQGENRLAAERVPFIPWDDYPYPAILVPGQGPNREGIALSPLGKIRCLLAAARFEDGWAPLITVSGGHVHPDRTPFSEAMEMKKYLTENLGIPENAVIVDPHARHTTTNLRNFARILFRYGIPTDRQALVTTDMFQAFYIAHMLDERCLDELGYLPYEQVTPISPVDSLFTPNMTSLHADPRDPLDP